MGKILLIDVDGTLVNYENKLPASAVSAIRSARQNGHRVYICSGRSRAEIYPNIWDIGLDGIIGGNGSYVEDHGQVIMHQLIPEQTSHAIVDWLHSRGLEFFLESNNGLFASEHFEERGQDTIKKYAQAKGKPDADTITIRDAFPEMIFDGELYRNDLNKISYILNSYQDYLDAVEQFEDVKHGTWGGAGETALFGDMGVKGINKANAIKCLLAHLNADQKDTIAFGDASVDIPMLEYCGIGVAMGNGGTEIKAMADYITADVDQDGLYKAFEHFDLI